MIAITLHNLLNELFDGFSILHQVYTYIAHFIELDSRSRVL